MATTVIGAFPDNDVIEKIKKELVKVGLASRDIEVLDGEEDEVVSTIVERGFDEADANAYAEAVNRGKVLIAAKVASDKADKALAVFRRYESAEENEEETAEQSQTRSRREETETVPVVEEELSISKRQVGRGGVRIVTNVVEKPVEERVALREEHVEFNRDKIDRELSPEEAEAAFKRKTVEVTATGEEVELRKEARVVEEISVGKRVEEREQTVRDKVRRTDVEVEEIDAKASRKR